MKIITCTRPNASTLISGVAFSESPDGMVSDPVEDGVAEHFARIPGYVIADVEPPKALVPDETKAPVKKSKE